jgi:hypothetical protein
VRHVLDLVALLAQFGEDQNRRRVHQLERGRDARIVWRPAARL